MSGYWVKVSFSVVCLFYFFLLLFLRLTARLATFKLDFPYSMKKYNEGVDECTYLQQLHTILTYNNISELHYIDLANAFVQSD